MDKIISIIVPCYNEQEVLYIFYSELIKVFDNMEYCYELILVNDGSSDGTLRIIQELARKDNIYFLFQEFWKGSSNVCWFL